MRALIAREACLHESMQTWLWRQDVLLFARYSRNRKFGNVFELKTPHIYFIYTHSLIS